VHEQGAIILATGGDNSNGAMGKFYEGIMVTGATE
jgi:non-reducing end alpha-L-arabinofuranosidase